MVSTRRSWGCAAQPGAGAAGAGAAWRRRTLPRPARTRKLPLAQPGAGAAGAGARPEEPEPAGAHPWSLERYTVWLAGVAAGAGAVQRRGPLPRSPACRPAWSRRSRGVDPPGGAGTSPRPAWSGRGVGSNRPEAPEVPAPPPGTGTKHKALTDLRVLV
jgi:hypothetical protein